ncbi:YceI family protein [Euzebyella marina]|uniref:YceI family protein n=1 Tax=Euzebyella marina TaxID=1761453 RepID=A0A3G2LA21_9FLAO|nr:YceI family protein [Euzebyella marina]AYN69097.1 YceI family protein [Euzebyella marina]
MKYIIAAFLMLGTICTNAQQEFSLNEESTLTIDGTSTIHDWTVNAEQLQGELIVDGGKPKKIDFAVAVEGIKSERGATMDNKMYNALKKDEHPNVTFSLTEVKGEGVLVGQLSIAGSQNEVEIPVSISDDGGYKITGEYKLALKDYGIEPPTAMFGQIVVGDDVTVKFDLKFAQ